MGSEPKGSPAGWFSLSDIGPTVRLFVLLLLPIIVDAITKFLETHQTWTWSDLVGAITAAIVAFFAKFVKDTRKP